MNLVALIFITSLVLGPPSGDDRQGKDESAQQRVDEILTNLQDRSDGLRDIRCKVRFIEDDRINLSKGTKTGEILFLMTEPNPRFLIRFDRTEREGVLGKREWYLFDGVWFYEALERIQQVTKREIAPAGEKLDMFDLERTPFPMPFGHKKDKILRNFEVKLIPPSDADPPETDHLLCVPKATSKLRDRYDRLDLFVLRDLHLPSRVVVTKNNGYEVLSAEFPDLTARSINAGIKPKDFRQPKAWKKYKVVEERLDSMERAHP